MEMAIQGGGRDAFGRIQNHLLQEGDSLEMPQKYGYQEAALGGRPTTAMPSIAEGLYIALFGRDGPDSEDTCAIVS